MHSSIIDYSIVAAHLHFAKLFYRFSSEIEQYY